MYLRGLIHSIIPFLALLFVNCSQDQKPLPVQSLQTGESQGIKDQFVKANQLMVQKESDEMDAYERSHGITFVRTRSGIRYFVYKASTSGDSIRKGMQVTLKYKVFLLDGTPCYSSDEDGLKSILVEQENIESGIHKGLQYLKRGDKALFLIPSPLAHGLLGDFRKIPPQMPIVYDVEVN